mmetsp:Transcript_37188/g.91544  ORF Transcript_37188/g.91544 Transcript_37188/m.91544 type:complete len:93 (+) Transcript_37188:250-528(+)
MSAEGGGSDVFHAQGAYILQDTCINVRSAQNIAGDWVKVPSGGTAGPGGSQLDKVRPGVCSGIYGLARTMKARTLPTVGGAKAKWDGRVLDI